MRLLLRYWDLHRTLSRLARILISLDFELRQRHGGLVRSGGFRGWDMKRYVPILVFDVRERGAETDDDEAEGDSDHRASLRGVS